MKVLTWLWKQKTSRFEYTTAHVNAWAESIRKNCTRDITIACITDCPEGLHDWIEVIPIPGDFAHIKTRVWGEHKGLPQCYKRLAMFAPDAGKWIGADRWLSMDLDCIVTSNIDHLIDRTEDFLIFRGTSKLRPCNGGFLIMNSGARPQVYTEFTAEGASAASNMFVGSDQAWIGYILGGKSKDWKRAWVETRIGEKEGVYHYSPAFVRLNGGARFVPPKNLCILFCPGNEKFFADMTFLNAKEEMIRNVEKCAGVRRTIAVSCYRAKQTFKGKHGKYKKGDILEEWEINPKWLRMGLVEKYTQYAAPQSDEPQLLALRDSKGWADQAAKWAGAKIIKSIYDAKKGDTVMVRMRCNGKAKAETLKAVKALHEKGCIPIPSLTEALFYDDKVEQKKLLNPWLPKTKVFTERKEAIEYAENEAFPKIAKKREGASSQNVALIKNKTACKRYITDNLKADGYVYFQDLIETDRDYRINVCGKYVFGKERFIRSKNEPFASGSGKNKVMDFKDTLQIKAAQMAVEICEQININWLCFDFVFDENEKCYVLEMSSAWQFEWYADCKLYNRQLELVDKPINSYFGELACLKSGQY